MSVERPVIQNKHFGIEVAKSLQWEHWEPGGEYTQQIILKNVNFKTKKLQYRISSRRFFTTRYPQPIVLSSGASIKLPITFRPTEKSLHEDVIEFITKDGVFQVAMRGVLPEPQLRLPDTINFGMCAVKDQLKISFQIINISKSHTTFQLLCKGPFTLMPNSGTLAPCTQCEISAQFKPEDAHVYNVDAICLFGRENEERISRVITLEGIGKYPHLGIKYGNLVATDVNLNFGDVCVGQRGEEIVELINYTPVDAPFQVLQKSRGILVENVFSSSHFHGTIPAESIMKITFNFQPENINTDYVDAFEILSVGLTSKSFIKCNGYGTGPDMKIDMSSINFGSTNPNTAVTRSIKIKNQSNFPAYFQFQIDKLNSVFQIDTPSGIINPKSSKTLIIKFVPVKPMVYFRRIYCLVHHQGALSIDVFGTCYQASQKPVILNQLHIRNFAIYSERGISRFPPDKILELIDEKKIQLDEDNLLEFLDEELKNCCGKTKVATNTMQEYFLQTNTDDLETHCPHVCLDTPYVNFGTCIEQSVYQKTINMSNHTRGKVTCSWINVDKAIFSVSPDEMDIEPLSSVSFCINFRPDASAKFFCEELEAYVFYKSMRDHSLVDDRTISPPWCVTVSCSANTFPKHSEKFNPVCKWDKNTMIFPPATPECTSVYRTCLLRNDGSNPIYYSFNDDTDKLVTCKPAISLARNLFQVIAFQMNLDGGSCKKNLICNINNDSKYGQGFEFTSTFETPQVALSPSDFVYFKPTCIGDMSHQVVTVKNTSRIKFRVHWKISKCDEDILKVSPECCDILPNEIQKHEWSFSPTTKSKHLFKVKLLLVGESSLKKPKKYELRLIGEGQDGRITCKESHVDFGSILIGCNEEKSISLLNDSDCSLHCELLIKPRSDSTIDNSDGTVLKLDHVNDLLPSYSSKKLVLTASPKSTQIYVYEILYKIPSKKQNEHVSGLANEGMNHLCTVTIQGVYPLLVIDDIYGTGCVERYSKMFLRQLFQLENLNTLLKTDPATEELKYSISSRHSTRRRMPVTTQATNQFDFGSCVQGSQPAIISLNFKNLGTSNIEWALKYPTDLLLDIEYWADSGQLEEDEMHEMYIMANELFSVEPRSGTIEPSKHETITFTYRHSSLGVHKMPLLFKIVQGREIRLNLLGQTLPSCHSFLHFTTLSHIFSPVSIGECSPKIQDYTLYNVSDETVRYTVDTSSLQQLRQENYDWPVFNCLTPSGEIAPYESCVLRWIFSPLEAKSYSVDVPILVFNGETTNICFMGSGYDPNHMANTMPLVVEKSSSQSTIALEKQVVQLSADHLFFGDIPLHSEQHQIIFISNKSRDHIMSYDWLIKGTVADGLISIYPKTGYLKPGESIVCKVQIFSYGPPAFHEFDIICKVVDETEMESYKQSMRDRHIKQEEKKMLFTITDKPRERQILKSKRKKETNLNRYEALPPIQSDEKLETPPWSFSLHLAVTVTTHAVGSWLKSNPVDVNKHFILRNPLNLKGFHEMKLRDEELDAVKYIFEMVIKDLLQEADFMSSLTRIQDEAIPYFRMLPNGDHTIDEANTLTDEVKTDILTSLHQRQKLKRSDELRHLLENVLENSLCNILCEDVSLTGRGRILARKI